MACKVTQWDIGNVGSQVIAAIAQRQELELTGLFVYSEENLAVMQERLLVLHQWVLRRLMMLTAFWPWRLIA